MTWLEVITGCGKGNSDGGDLSDRPGKHRSKTYLERKRKEAEGKGRRKVGLAEKPGDAEQLCSREGDKSVSVNRGKKSQGRESRSARGRTTIRQYQAPSHHVSPEH